MAFNLVTYRNTPTWTSGDAKFGSGGLSGGGLKDASVSLDNFLSTTGANGGNLTTGTIEAWAKSGSITATKVVAGRNGWYWMGAVSGGNAQANVGTGGGAVNITTTVNICDGAWHHLALVITPTGATFYVDGAVAGSTSYASKAVGFTGNTPGFIVADYGSTTATLNWIGSVDEVRVSTTARYTGAFTPPSAAFTDDASTAALYHLEADGTDSHVAGGGDTTPPSVPGTPTAVAGNGQATVTFAGSTDDVAVAGYRVYSSADSFTAVAASGSASPITVTGLTNGTAYTFEVAAYDAAGNQSAKSAASNSVTPSSSINITPNDANIGYSPYTWLVTGASAKTINAGAYLRAEIAGTPTAIVANFNVSGDTAPLPTFAYRIDGGAWTVATVAATVTLTLPSDNTWTKRTVEIVIKASAQSVDRWNAQANAVVFTGFTTTPGTCTTAAVQTRALKVIVFGDSITEGVYVLRSNSTDILNNDATRCWSWLLRDALGAEVGVVGFGSQGISVGGNGNVPALTSSYSSLWNGQARDLTTSPPDVIVCNMGHNDNLTDTTAAMTGLLNAWLAATPATTKIVLINPFSGRQAAFLQAAAAACTQPRRVTWVDTTGWFNSADSPDGVHPYGYVSLTQLAPRAAAAIRSALGRGRGYINIAGTAKAVTAIVR